jgi:hypothetical protein
MSEVEQGLIGPWLIGVTDEMCSSMHYEIPCERAMLHSKINSIRKLSTAIAWSAMLCIITSYITSIRTLENYPRS